MIKIIYKPDYVYGPNSVIINKDGIGVVGLFGSGLFYTFYP